MFYILWDLQTRNIITQIATEEEAFALVRAVVEDGDEEEIASLGLIRHVDSSDRGTVVASGADLVRLATVPASA